MSLSAPLKLLESVPRWVNYTLEPDPDRAGKTIKRPINSRTGYHMAVTNAGAWSTYEQACARSPLRGFVFSDLDDIWFVDIDGCLVGGEWSSLAQDLCRRLAGAAVEVSQSGTGLHLFGRGVVPPHSSRNIAAGIELYTTGRFVALTDMQTAGDVNTDHSAAMASIVETFFPHNPHGEIAGWTDAPVADYGGPADDVGLLRAAMASGKKNMANAFGGGITFEDLWTANVDKLAAKFPSANGDFDHSLADASLASHLAYWTGNNHERIRDLMFQSALAREKWEARPDWLELTILKASSVVTNVAKARDALRPSGGTDFGSDQGTLPRLHITFDGDEDRAPQTELIKGLLPDRGVAFLGGQSGAGKTFVAIDLAVALASPSNAEFFERRVKERVGIAIFAAEGEGTLSLRLRAAKKQREISDRLPIAHFNLSYDLTSAEGLSELNEKLDEIENRIQVDFGIRLGAVIIDTVAAGFAMENENDNAEAAQIIRNLQTLSNARIALVIAVHHYGKAEGAGLRGASAFRAGADAILSVTASRNETTGVTDNRALALAKSRAGVEGPVSGFDLVPVWFGLDDDGDPYGSCAIVPNDRAMPQGRGRKEPQARVDFRAAFDAAISINGVKHSKMTGKPDGFAVQAELVRREFSNRRPNSGGDPRKRAEASRKAFKHSLDHLKNEFSIQHDDHGLEWIWAIN